MLALANLPLMGIACHTSDKIIDDGRDGGFLAAQTVIERFPSRWSQPTAAHAVALRPSARDRESWQVMQTMRHDGSSG